MAELTVERSQSDPDVTPLASEGSDATNGDDDDLRHIIHNESTSLLRRNRSLSADDRHPGRLIPEVDHTWLPAEDDTHGFTDFHRSIRRRIFLLLTEPSSSVGSLVFFTILILTIALSNLIMILQTMEQWQFTPTDCITCGGDKLYMFEDDDTAALDSGLPNCVCPPAPKQFTVVAEDYLIYFFSVEWILRMLCFEPPSHEKADSFAGFLNQLLGYLTETTTILDFFAIFPYYMERFGSNTKGLLSLRLLRLFRVFQLVRLGQFNDTFKSLQNVLANSVPYLRLLLVVLLFGSAFFGSMMYWLEKGEWKYWDDTGDFEFIRVATDGVTEEISPFTDIPQAFWWFMVTATTVGYGDMYPTSGGGKAIAVLAMLTGVLVIAFPVSVFSDLWQKELKVEKVIEEKEEHEDAIEFLPEDVNALVKHIQAVDIHQAHIRDILLKYALDT
jgi:voltage-gated potassium channel